MEFYDKITKIKKGDRFLCVSKYPDIFKKGNIYTAHGNDKIRYGDNGSFYPFVNVANKYFLKIKPEKKIDKNKVSESDLIGDIKGLPIEVVQKMCEEQVRQGNKFDVSVFQNKKNASKKDKGFTWSDSIENDAEFWLYVINCKEFDIFFEKYPKENKKPNEKEDLSKLLENIALNSGGWEINNRVIQPLPLMGLPFTTPDYYDNSKGSLYKVGIERGWNLYLFDLVKRLERGGKKDPLKQEIEKSIALLQLWLKEINE